MKSVVMAMVIALVLSLIGWFIWAKSMENFAVEQDIITQEKLYDKGDRKKLSKDYEKRTGKTVSTKSIVQR